MLDHQIPNNLIEPLTKGPSQTKITQVSNLQNYIQSLLGDSHHTFLQGSYKNNTAISDINDVDIVAVRRITFSGTFSPIRAPQSILWDQIFSEIEEKLRRQSKYSWTVTRGDKCIKIRGAFNADVIPAVQVNPDPFIDPIVVYSFRSAREKINSPRIHYDNGVIKHQSTNEIYKLTVRIFKNWTKNHFNENNDIISSFKIESLVYNVENNNFYSDFPSTFFIVGNSILNKLTESSLPFSIPSVCGQENILESWDPSNKDIFIDQLRESLNQVLNAYQAILQSEAENYWKAAFNI